MVNLLVGSVGSGKYLQVKGIVVATGSSANGVLHLEITVVQAFGHHEVDRRPH